MSLVQILRNWPSPKTGSSSFGEERWKKEGQTGRIRFECKRENPKKRRLKKIAVSFSREAPCWESWASMTALRHQGARPCLADLPSAPRVLLLIQVSNLSPKHPIFVLPSRKEEDGAPAWKDMSQKPRSRYLLDSIRQNLPRDHTELQRGLEMRSLFQDMVSPVENQGILFLMRKGARWWFTQSPADTQTRYSLWEFSSFYSPVFSRSFRCTWCLSLLKQKVPLDKTANYIINKGQSSLGKGDREDLHCSKQEISKLSRSVKIVQKSENGNTKTTQFLQDPRNSPDKTVNHGYQFKTKNKAFGVTRN